MNQATTAQLPSMPGTVIRLLQMFADPEVCLDDVVDTIKTDAALASRILKAANSSAVAASREVSDLKRAATLLGKKTISTLSLSFSLADQSMAEDAHAELFREFWNQSLITGVAASVLAKRYGSPQPDAAFLIGLLSRIGRLGAISFAPEEYGACAEVAARSGCGVDTMCLSSMGVNCEQLTLDYMRAWKLPPLFIEHIAGMQDAGQRDRCRATESGTEGGTHTLDACTCLRVAAAIGQFFAGDNSGIALATIHELMAPVLADLDQDVDRLIADVTDEFDRYSEILDVDTKAIGTPAELHARAMANLTEIALAPEPAFRDATAESSSEVAWLQDRVRDLAEQLTLDSMTSLHNRAHFDSELEKRIAIARQSEGFVAVLFIDINCFKHVNDTYGHDVGDQAICAVAERLKSVIRRDDVVARYGGDEFVILCEMNSFKGLDAQAQRVTELMNGLTVPCGSETLDISIAIGGAIGAPDGGSDFGERLLRASDKAMYEAKETRSNPFVIGISHYNAAGEAVAVEAAMMSS